MQKQEQLTRRKTAHKAITKQNKIQQNNGTTEDKVAKNESNALGRNLNTKHT